MVIRHFFTFRGFLPDSTNVFKNNRWFRKRKCKKKRFLSSWLNECFDKTFVTSGRAKCLLLLDVRKFLRNFGRITMNSHGISQFSPTFSKNYHEQLWIFAISSGILEELPWTVMEFREFPQEFWKNYHEQSWNFAKIWPEARKSFFLDPSPPLKKVNWS